MQLRRREKKTKPKQKLLKTCSGIIPIYSLPPGVPVCPWRIKSGMWWRLRQIAASPPRSLLIRLPYWTLHLSQINPVNKMIIYLFQEIKLHWNFLRKTWMSQRYKTMCEHLLPYQTSVRQIFVERWMAFQNSVQSMLFLRRRN